MSKYPDLVAELLRRNWSDEEVREALGRNLLRVFREVEAVRARAHLLQMLKLTIIPNLLLTEVKVTCVSLGKRQHECSQSR